MESETTYGMWVPKGLNHGSLKWHEVRKPLIEMAIMRGAGAVLEGWKDSFFIEPDKRQSLRKP